MVIATIVGGVIVVAGYFIYQWALVAAGSLEADAGKSALATAGAYVAANTFQVFVGAVMAIPVVLAICDAYPPIKRWGAGPSWVEE